MTMIIIKLYSCVKFQVIRNKWLISFFLFNGILTFVGYFNLKALILGELWENKRVQTFPKNLNVNVKARLKFTLSDHDIANQHVSHSTVGPHPIVNFFIYLLHTHTHIYICVCVCVSIYIYVCIYVCVYVYVYIYMYIYI